MSKDIFGVEWDLPPARLCPTCGQPDDYDDCNHTQLTPGEVVELKG